MVDEQVLVPVDFDDLDDWLHSVGSDFSAAELHGALVGGLAGAMRLSIADWSAFGLAVMGADERLLANDKVNKVLGYLAQEQLDLLAGEELLFSPFLPEDDIAIAERVEAMSLWCKGFLGGFAEAQVLQSEGDQAEVQASVDQLPPNVAEALQDMTAIAQASLDAADMDDGEFDTDDDYDDENEAFDATSSDYLDEDGLADSALGEANLDEYNERDFFELIEYLRFAAMTVFTEYGWVEMQDDGQANKVRSALKNAIELEGSSSRTLH